MWAGTSMKGTVGEESATFGNRLFVTPWVVRYSVHVHVDDSKYQFMQVNYPVYTDNFKLVTNWFVRK